MAQPEQIADVRNLPNLKDIPRSLVVRSVERVQGRTVSQDTMLVGCTNWSPMQRALGPKQLGKFYVNPPFLQTLEWTLFQVGTKTLRVRVGKGIPLEIADELIPKIVKGDVQLGRDVSDAEWSQARLSEPAVLSRHPTTGQYLVYFGNPLHAMVTVQLHNGRALVTRYSMWVN